MPASSPNNTSNRNPTCSHSHTRRKTPSLTAQPISHRATYTQNHHVIPAHSDRVPLVSSTARKQSPSEMPLHLHLQRTPLPLPLPITNPLPSHIMHNALYHLKHNAMAATKYQESRSHQEEALHSHTLILLPRSSYAQYCRDLPLSDHCFAPTSPTERRCCPG